jgi:lipase
VSVLEITDATVEVAGGALCVARLGAGEGAPAVAVHGITSSSRAWLAVARALRARVTLHALDLRGRGASRELPGPYGMATHTADLLAVLDRLGLERAVLVGHSLGAYVVARFAVEHPDRVRAVVLVDGGLAIPGADGVDPQAFADAFLGPALARLRMRFASVEEYQRWWRAHPALGGVEVDDEDLFAYAAHDLVGDRPAVSDDAVRADVLGLVDTGYAHELSVSARMLTAPRGLADEPSPMQPLAQAQAWAAEAPSLRSASLVPDVNHYTITLGADGAAAVADAIAAAVSGEPT